MKTIKGTEKKSKIRRRRTRISVLKNEGEALTVLLTCY
jgi:hypothetical protein